MLDTLKYVYQTCVQSGTIIWARLQYPIAAAWFAISTTDLGPVLGNPKYLAYWMVFNAFVTELTRRRGAEYDHEGNMK